MSEKTFTFTECVIVIACLGFLQSVNREQPDQPPKKKEADVFGPPHEKGSDSIKRPDYTLENLLAQIPEDDSNSKKAKDAPFGPPRREKGSDSIKRPDWTLKDLLDQVKENSSHDEIDTGPPVGNEVW
ncbi:hypothetical protein C6501_16960 [Candidatus Poribacteria bacterium]|nr:MAG: hypothetical protein C6501_16960 [Candidatus Poribacteria bacterium]